MKYTSSYLTRVWEIFLGRKCPKCERFNLKEAFYLPPCSIKEWQCHSCGQKYHSFIEDNFTSLYCDDVSDSPYY